MSGKLYLVPTPIGNYDDITLRALKVLQESDFVICEEFKEARRLLSFYKIEKKLLSINEHNEEEEVSEIIKRISKGETAALISDCGTPLFSDPGHILVNRALIAKIKIISLPGASSLMPALTLSDFDFEKFFYYGWLSPKKELRRQELFRLKKIREVIVLLDTPYRLKAVLKDLVKIFGSDLPVIVAFQLTMENEEVLRGKTGKILAEVEKRNLKGEFVIIINNK